MKQVAELPGGKVAYPTSDIPHPASTKSEIQNPKSQIKGAVL